MSEIDVGRGRQEAFARQHPAALESLEQLALIQSVEASNAIENITVPRRRLEELVAQNTTPLNRSEAEIAGYRAVLETIHSSAEQIPLSPNLVLQLHRDLYQFAPRSGGRWKNSNNVVTGERADATVAVRFAPFPRWHEAEHDLRPWLSYFLGVITAAYREFEPRAEAVTAGRGSKAELVKSFVRPTSATPSPSPT